MSRSSDADIDRQNTERHASEAALAAMEEVYAEKQRRILAGHDFLSLAEEAMIIDKHFNPTPLDASTTHP